MGAWPKTAETALCESCGRKRCSGSTRLCAEQCLPASLGITYRQLNHWPVQGWLRPVFEGGSGRNREWPEAELEIARRMAKLIDAGLTVPAAAKFARDAWPFGEIAPGADLWIWERP